MTGVIKEETAVRLFSYIESGTVEDFEKFKEELENLDSLAKKAGLDFNVNAKFKREKPSFCWTSSFLRCALTSSRQKFVEHLCETYHVTVDSFDLFIPISRADPSSLKALTKTNLILDKDYVDVGERTPLCTAAMRNSTDCLNILLDAGASLEFPSRYGTPLWTAAAFGSNECLNALIARGALVNAANVNGRTALDIAASQGNVECLKTLIKAGALLNAASKDGITALHLAARDGNAECLKILIEAGASLTATTKLGETALFAAASMNRVAIANMLFNYGVIVDKKTANEHANFYSEMGRLISSKSKEDRDSIKQQEEKEKKRYKKNKAQERKAITKPATKELQAFIQNNNITEFKNLLTNIETYLVVGDKTLNLNDLFTIKEGPAPIKVSLLGYAVREGREEIVAILVDKGAKVTSEIMNKADKMIHPLLSEAFHQQQAQAIKRRILVGLQEYLKPPTWQRWKCKNRSSAEEFLDWLRHENSHDLTQLQAYLAQELSTFLPNSNGQTGKQQDGFYTMLEESNRRLTAVMEVLDLKPARVLKVPSVQTNETKQALSKPLAREITLAEEEFSSRPSANYVPSHPKADYDYLNAQMSSASEHSATVYHGKDFYVAQVSEPAKTPAVVPSLSVPSSSASASSTTKILNAVGDTQKRQEGKQQQVSYVLANQSISVSPSNVEVVEADKVTSKPQEKTATAKFSFWKPSSWSFKRIQAEGETMNKDAADKVCKTMPPVSTTPLASPQPQKAKTNTQPSAQPA